MLQRKLLRAQLHNYNANGYYFVTICTKYFYDYFGEIDDEKMKFNQLGEIANNCRKQIPDHCECVLDEFIVMPNHVHGIIILDNKYSGRGSIYAAPIGKISARNGKSSASIDNVSRSKMKLSRIMQLYKAAVSRDIRKISRFENYQWHRSFYDHVVRNQISLERIRKYIVNNPIKREIDRNNVKKEHRSIGKL